MQGIKSGAAGGGGGGDSPVVLLFSQTLAADAAEVSIDLSAIDLSQYQELRLVLGNAAVVCTSNASMRMTVNGQESAVYKKGSDTSSYIGWNSSANSGTGKNSAVIRILNCGGYVLFEGDAYYGTANRSGIGPKVWTGGGMADMTSLTIRGGTGTSTFTAASVAAGMRLALYGYRM